MGKGLFLVPADLTGDNVPSGRIYSCSSGSVIHCPDPASLTNRSSRFFPE